MDDRIPKKNALFHEAADFLQPLGIFLGRLIEKRNEFLQHVVPLNGIGVYALIRGDFLDLLDALVVLRLNLGVQNIIELVVKVVGLFNDGAPFLFNLDLLARP